MPLDLVSAYAKLARAQEHFEHLDAVVTQFLIEAPYTITGELNADFTRYSLVAHLRGDPPPTLRWTLIAGDCIANLRAALEHLAFALLIYQHFPEAPPNQSRIAFVLADDPKRFNASDRLKDLSASMRALIEEVQPYHRTNARTRPYLSILRDLANTDKHRLIELAFTCPVQGNLRLRGRNFRDRPNTIGHSFEAGELKDGTEVFTMTSEISDPDMGCDGAVFEFVVAMWHTAPNASATLMDRSDVRALLPKLIAEVRDVIETVARQVM